MNCYKILHHFFLAVVSFCFLDACAAPQSYLTVFPDQKPNFQKKEWPHVNVKAPQGGTLALSYSTSFNTFDPASDQGITAPGLEHTSASLFQLNPHESLIAYPYAATNVELFSDKVIFHLHHQACFQDGNPLQAQDVKATFEHLLKNPQYRSYLKDIKSVEIAGRHEVIFHLNKNFSRETPLNIALIPLHSQKFLQQVKQNPLTPPLASGPYRILSFKPDTAVVYERIPNWWGNSLVHNKGRHNFKTVRYERFGESAVILEALRKGDINYVENVVAKDWAKNQERLRNTNIASVEFPYKGPTGHMAFIFNMRKPILQDPAVREALHMMFPFAELNKRLFNDSYRRNTVPFENTPMQARALPDQEELALIDTLKHKEDIPALALSTPVENFIIEIGSARERKEKVLSLLKQAGWFLQEGKLHHKDYGPLTLTILSHSPEMDRVLQYLQNVYKKVGITLNIHKVEATEYISKLHDFNFDIVISPLVRSGDMPGNELFSDLSSQSAMQKSSHNLSGLKNPAVDELVQKIIYARTKKELEGYAHILGRVLLALRLGIPMWHSNSRRIHFDKNRLAYPEEASPQGVDLSTWWSSERAQ